VVIRASVLTITHPGRELTEVSTTTDTTPAPGVAEIRAELDAIAPMPEDGPITARELARHFAVRAGQRGWLALNGSSDEGLDPVRIAAMTAEFAAAHALLALAELTPDDADIVADQVRDAIWDGGGIGEWLWEHLGDETSRKVNDLMEQLAAALKEADEPAAEPEPTPAGRLARVEVKGFRDLGIVRVTETTLAGEPMLHAERTEWSGPGFKGDAADFPASSVHFVTWLPEGAVPASNARPAITAGDDGDPWGSDDDDYENGPF